MTGRTPVRYNKRLRPTTLGQNVLMIGFPSGMPAKVEAGGKVSDSGASNGYRYFEATLDAFKGNSN